MRKLFPVLLLLFALTGGLFYLLISPRPGKSDNSVSQEPREYRSSAPERIVTDNPVDNRLTEVPSGDPRIRSYVGADGKRAKIIRLDEKERPVIETVYKDGQELKVERLFSDEGKLLKERHLRNDALIREDVFR